MAFASLKTPQKTENQPQYKGNLHQFGAFLSTENPKCKTLKFKHLNLFELK